MLSISGMRRVALGGVFVGLSSLAMALPANAVSVTDNYWGGINTYNPSNGDRIGDSRYEIYGAEVTRGGTSGNDLTVKFYNNFVNSSALGEYNIGLGAMFLGNGADPVAASLDATHHAGTDTFSPSNTGRFQFAAVIPGTPSGASGSGTIYALNGTGSDVQLSNVNGNTTTYPNTGSGSFYFRQNQAVGVKSGTNAPTALTNAVSWSIGTGTWGTHSTGTLTFNIANAFGSLDSFGSLTDTFTFAWEMTCANDVMLATVGLHSPAVSTTPLPASLPLFVGGMGLVGFLSRKRRNKAAASAA